MSDTPSDKPSHDPSPEKLPPDNIDDVLSQASSLADDLANEVGTSDNEAVLSEDDVAFLANSASDSDTVDAQLDQIEQRLAETESELTETSEENEPTTEEMDYKAAAASFGDLSASSPDFTSEEPDSEEPTPEKAEPPRGETIQLCKRAPKEPADTEQQADHAAPTGIDISDQDLGDLSGDASVPSLDDSAVPSLEPDEPNKSEATSSTTSAPVAKPTIVTAAANALCTGLEVVDVPFRPVGEKVRNLLGWLALAILFAAFLVFVLSFFQ